MRLGIDAFTLYPLKLDPFATLAYVAEHRLDGVQFGGIRGLAPELDAGRLGELRAEAARLGLYLEVSLSTCNPHLFKGSRTEHLAVLTAEIEVAAAQGWHEVRGILGNGPERYEHPVPWTQHLAAATELLAALAPLLRAHGSRISLETHGDVTTFEIIRLIEAVGADVAGICLDTANLYCHAEDPVSATLRAAPYTRMTHIKDARVFLTEDGLVRQTVPAGQGQLDWPRILSILSAHQPQLNLSIEDHQWLFSFAVLDPAWLALHPDLTAVELAATVRAAYAGRQAVLAGTWPEPESTEAVGYEHHLAARLPVGRDYLRDVLAALATE